MVYTLLIIIEYSDSKIVVEISVLFSILLLGFSIYKICFNPPLKTVELGYDYQLAYIDESVSMEEVREKYLIVSIKDDVYTLCELPQKECEHDWAVLGENGENKYAIFCSKCEITKNITIEE